MPNPIQVNMLAREYCDAATPKIKHKPIILSHRACLYRQSWWTGAGTPAASHAFTPAPLPPPVQTC